MINLKNINYSYPHSGLSVLEDISFKLKKGELLLCTGASGSGKSTLLKVINGLIPHYEKGSFDGRALVSGADTLAFMPSDLASKVGTLFQDPERQFFALTVKDEVALSLQWRSWPIEKTEKAVLKALDRMGILDLKNQSIFSLSEGQKQKVALASILALEPEIIVLDEPTANLDPLACKDLAKTLEKLKSQGLSLVVVDHRLWWLEDLADKVMILEDGKLAEKGDFGLLKSNEIRKKYGLRTIKNEPINTSIPPLDDDKENFVQCSKLSFKYPRGPEVLRETELSFPAGEVVALIGKNGVGKTSLARLMAGLEKADKGDIYVDFKKIVPKNLARYVQLVLQNAGHQLRMQSVELELEDAGKGVVSGSDLSKLVKDTMEDFGLLPLAKRHPQSLSGGEKQRLAIACATIRSPRVIIFDEPTSGLDGLNLRRIASIIKKIASRGACVIVISHDHELINLACSRVFELVAPLSEESF